MSIYKSLALCGAFLTALVAQNAFAETTSLTPVTITASKLPLSASTKEEAKEKLAKVAGGANVVDSKSYENTRAVTLKDMLDYSPGVFSQPRYGEEARLAIRGSGLSRTYHMRGLTMLQDGMPINMADGAADFQDIDPLAFDHVEVYRGANALQYGAASLGGAINFVTPTGYTSPKAKLRLEAGSFNTRRAQIQTGGVAGNTDMYASLSSLQSDGYRDYNHTENTRFFGNVGQKLSDQLETRFYVTHGDINLELPGSITKEQMNKNPKQAYAGYVAQKYQRDFTVTRLSNKTTWKNDFMEVNGGVYTAQKDLFHPIFQIVDQQNSDYGAFANSTINSQFAGHNNEFTFGTFLQNGSTDSKRYVNNAASYGAKTYDSQEKSQNANFYAENHFWVLPDVSLNAGGQYVVAKRDFKDRFLSDGDKSGEKTYHGFSPKVGALWQATPEVQLFANVSRSFEPPTFSELTQYIPGVSGLADIEAQKATTFELGSRGEFKSINWDVAVYRSYVKDELMSYAVNSSGATAVLNADKTIHQGIELGLGTVFKEGIFENGERSKDSISTRIAYQLNDFHFDGDSQWGDNDVPGIPEQYIRAELRYDHPYGFYIAPNVEVVPEGYAVDMKNTLYSDAYSLFNVNAGHKINDHVSVFVDARNLADKTYAATTGIINEPTATNTAVFYPGDGRSVFVGLTVSW